MANNDTNPVLSMENKELGMAIFKGHVKTLSPSDVESLHIQEQSATVKMLDSCVNELCKSLTPYKLLEQVVYP